MAAARHEEQMVVFQPAAEPYGIDIGRGLEIKITSSATRVPRAPDPAEGLVSLRGRITPLIDMHVRFGRDRLSRYHKESCTLLVV
jgi:purine-binding chemotaxis protein CheW